LPFRPSGGVQSNIEEPELEPRDYPNTGVVRSLEEGVLPVH